MADDEEGGAPRTSAKPRLLLTPEPFTGTGSFTDWVDHFEGVAAINEWDDATKLMWMKVRLVGRAQTAYGRLSTEAKGSYAALKTALKERFEPDSRRELYLSEFSTKKRKVGEGWAEYADELRVLADKAFPELEEKARERLALNHYLSQLDNPQVAFNVKQKRPTNLVEAVGSTLEMESYLLPQPSKVATVDVEQHTAIAAVQSKQESMMGMLQTMMERLDRLEKQMHTPTRPTQTGPPSHSRPIICNKCGQEGHYARGCAKPRRTNRPAPETNNDTVAVVPVSRSFIVSGSTNGVPTTFILDTGAAVTLLRKDVWDKLQMNDTSLEAWDGNPLVGVSGKPLEIWGSAKVKVEIAGEVFNTRVVVA